MSALEKQTLTYYHWADIQKFLCEAMVIDSWHFRNYHELVGGAYKDFWHVWLEIVEGNVENDMYCTHFFNVMLDDDFKKEVTQERGDWTIELYEAIEKLQKEVNVETITIFYNW